MAIINTNVKALFSQAALRSTERHQAVAMQQLSTGKRINSARDDAAGMAIATRMTHQIRSLNQAVRNAGDAISLIQTAEGATNEITDMLQRMRELAVQAVNDTNDNAQRSYLDLEFQQLKQQIVQIADNTEWNGFPLLSGKAGQQVGEMPVYKTTSINQFGEISIQPTTTRTLEGAGAGEQQAIKFNDPSALSITGTQTIKVGGVDVKFDSSHTTSADDFAEHVKEELEKTAAFGSGSGRTITIDPNATDTLLFGFEASKGDVPDVKVEDPGLVGITADTAVLKQSAIVSTHESFKDNGKFVLSGSLSVTLPTLTTPLVANFMTSDNKLVKMTGEFDSTTGKVSFLVKDGSNAKVISDDLTYTLQDVDGHAFDASTPKLDLSDRAVKLSVDVSGTIPPLRAGDLIINGVDIGGSYAADDKFSPVNNASGSAIAKAAAINRKAATSGIATGESQSITFSGNPLPGLITIGGVQVQLTAADNTSALATAKIAAALKNSPQFGLDSGRSVTYAQGGSVINIDYPVSDGDVPEINIEQGQTALTGVANTTAKFSTSSPGTGVYAKVNENIFTGKAMSGTSVVTGVVFINGFASANIQTVMNNPRETRANVAKAINLISDRTGVKAIDTGSESQGISLVAADGRNIEVRFETSANASVFGDRIGMREGVQSSTISLESKIPAPVVLSNSATGDIARAGLIEGNFTKNQSVYNTKPRELALPAVAQVSSIKITSSPAGFAVDDEFSAIVNGKKYDYKLTADDIAIPITAQGVRDKLILAIGVDLDVDAIAGSSTGEILIKSKTPGQPFTLTTAQVVDAGLSSGKISAPETLVDSKLATFKPLGMDDLQINGVKIRPTTSADDEYSNTVASSSDRASSGIALATAINASTPETGVKAVANPAVIKGGDTQTSNSMVKGLDLNDQPVKAPEGVQHLFVNGIDIAVDFKLNEPKKDRIAKVVTAINERVGQHGVTAVDNGKGVTLNSDGRNLSVWFDSSIEGLSGASFGLDQPGAEAQISKVKFGGLPTSGKEVTLTINDIQVIATTSGTGADTLAKDMVAAINAQEGLENVFAYVNPDDPESILIQSKVPGSPFEVNGAGNDDPAYINMSVGMVKPNNYGSSQVTGIPDATALSDSARTVYSTVRLVAVAAQLPALPGVAGIPPNLLGVSGRPIEISTGADGFGKNSNFADLGFLVGGFGGRSSSDMDPPRVGRLAFQIGSSAGQMVTIDLADFGKGGPITGEITGDVDQAVENRSVRINTGDGATAVLNLLDDAMDKVNATRATMGAVMNRLDHVINNLTNVSMNMSASRSQIEDADYAAASTDMAKNQIMQQAATAVLAQANTSQQSVLKLLGG